jgi:hypothetical protein
MNLHRVIRKRLSRKGLDAAVHAVVSVNTGGGSQKTSVTSRQTVVQRSGRR